MYLLMSDFRKVQYRSLQICILCQFLLQFSSLGSLDEKWIAELTSSLSAGFSEGKTPLGMGEPQIIWPTIEDVRCSLEVKNVDFEDAFLFTEK